MYQKLWSDDVRFLRYGARRTDRWKKWHIEVDVFNNKLELRFQFNLHWVDGQTKESSHISSLQVTLYSKLITKMQWFALDEKGHPHPHPLHSDQNWLWDSQTADKKNHSHILLRYYERPLAEAESSFEVGITWTLETDLLLM